MLLLLASLADSNGRRGQIVNDPVVMISVFDVQLELGCIQLLQLHLTQNLTVGLVQHADHVRRALNLVAREKFAERLGDHFWTALGLAEGKAVVVAGDLCVRGREGVDFEGDSLALLEGDGRRAGDVKGGRDGQRGEEE